MSVASEITRLQNAKASLKTSINAKTDAQHQITTETIDDYSDFVDSIQTGGGGGSEFTGHYDATGLATIGWSSEEIQYYQNNGVQWNSESDNDFKLTATELAGDDTSATRFIRKNIVVPTNFERYSKLLAIPILDLTNKTSLQTFFWHCESLTTIPLLNTSNITKMNQMFQYCYSLTSIPLLDTSEVTNMESMFYSCFSLKTIPLLNTSKVINTGSMFSECRALKTIPLIDTSKATNMNSMFSYCYSLKAIPQLDTSKSSTNAYMFRYCYALQSIPQLDMSSTTNMSSMFDECPRLTDTSLDNILKMCINVNPSYSRAKTLAHLGFNSTHYPASRIQALPSYQDFITAGWTIGY